MCAPDGSLYTYEPNVPRGTDVGLNRGTTDAGACEVIAAGVALPWAARAAALCTVAVQAPDTTAASIATLSGRVRFSASANWSVIGAFFGVSAPSPVRLPRLILSLIMSFARS